MYLNNSILGMGSGVVGDAQEIFRSFGWWLSLDQSAVQAGTPKDRDFDPLYSVKMRPIAVIRCCNKKHYDLLQALIRGRPIELPRRR